MNSEDVSVCPICFTTGLMEFRGRHHAQCGKCKSMERGRLAWMVMTRLGCLRPNVRFLNFAPEPFMLNYGRRVVGDGYEAADYSPELFGEHAPNIRKLDMCNDISHIPKETYDVVMHNHVLEHVPCHVPTVLRNLCSIVKPSGWHIFSIPIFPNRVNEEDYSDSVSSQERARRFGQSDHVRCFGKDFMDILTEAGLVGGLFDISKLFQENELAIWGVPVDAISGMTSHRVFAWSPALAPKAYR
ncbi:MAG: hypothetical protein B7Z22_10415 [Hyphomonas sp. 32-62-5]|nr:MAG: hypothetical protein B7Z22_10415 [Hyphomonas sp. 32-62-5]